MTRTRLALAALSTSSALALCAPAFAQTTGTGSPTQGPAQNTPQANLGGSGAQTVGEIVVTAQKRVQSVQDVPLAVTVVGSEQLARQNIQNVTQLPNAVPALAKWRPSWSTAATPRRELRNRHAATLGSVPGRGTATPAAA